MKKGANAGTIPRTTGSMGDGRRMGKKDDGIWRIRSGLSSVDSLVFAAYLGVIGARQSPASAIYLKGIVRGKDGSSGTLVQPNSTPGNHLMRLGDSCADACVLIGRTAGGEYHVSNARVVNHDLR